jgi:IclR family transcriptional regulator, acetate operon repressor
MTVIRSVSRASRILVHLGEQQESRSAKEIAAALGLALPTAYHLLGTLVGEGLLTKDSGRGYQLGPALAAITNAYMRQFTPPDYLVGPLRQLADASGETAYVGCWRQNRLAVLAFIEGKNAVRVSGTHIGFVGNGHARASGKVLLAFAPDSLREAYLLENPLVGVTPRTIVEPSELRLELERSHLLGFAVDEEEFREGVACVAAPLLESGFPVAAYSISAPVERFRRRRQEFIDLVVEATRQAAGERDGRSELRAALSAS